MDRPKYLTDADLEVRSDNAIYRLVTEGISTAETLDDIETVLKFAEKIDPREIPTLVDAAVTLSQIYLADGEEILPLLSNLRAKACSEKQLQKCVPHLAKAIIAVPFSDSLDTFVKWLKVNRPQTFARVYQCVIDSLSLGNLSLKSRENAINNLNLWHHPDRRILSQIVYPFCREMLMDEYGDFVSPIPEKAAELAIKLGGIYFDQIAYDTLFFALNGAHHSFVVFQAAALQSPFDARLRRLAQHVLEEDIVKNQRINENHHAIASCLGIPDAFFERHYEAIEKSQRNAQRKWERGEKPSAGPDLAQRVVPLLRETVVKPAFDRPAVRQSFEAGQFVFCAEMILKDPELEVKCRRIFGVEKLGIPIGRQLLATNLALISGIDRVRIQSNS